MLSAILLAVAPSTAAVPNLNLVRPGDSDRPLAVRITYPTTGSKLPVIVWSHGLGGSKDGYGPIATALADRGYVVIQPTHADSLSLLPPRERLRGARGQSTANWRERTEEVKLILDRLPEIEKQVPALAGRVDAGAVGVAGHSFGAHTTQLLAGTRLAGRTFDDPRPKAFVFVSPQGTGPGMPADAWSGIRRPVLMISGDNDISAINDKPASWRMEVWQGLPPGDKFLVWIKDAHHNFGGISGPIRFASSGPANPDHVKLVQDSIATFFDHYLKGDAKARQSFEGKAFPGAKASHRLERK